MNKVTIFKYEENKPVRIMNINGEPWFVLKDVCEVLGMDSTQLKKVADRLEEDEKGRTQITTPAEHRRVGLSASPACTTSSCAAISQRPNPSASGSRPWCCPASARMAATLPGRRAFPAGAYGKGPAGGPEPADQLPRNRQAGHQEKDFIGWLLDHKYVYRDQKNKLMPYAAKNNGLFEVKEGKAGTTTGRNPDAHHPEGPGNLPPAVQGTACFTAVRRIVNRHQGD